MPAYDTLTIETPNNAEKLIFGRRIAYIIENSGLSKAWIAERLGISKQALNYLLKHATKPKFVDELAEILELNPEWVEKGVGTPWANKKSKLIYSAKQIPLLTKTEILNKPTGPWKSKDAIDFSSDPIENFVAYTLEDDSNFPPFIQGSILIFNTEKQPQSNDYVLLMIENDVFVRQCLVDGDNICYKASNPGHKTFINPKAKLLGVLIEARYQVN
jgi:transcriptional regulator with XRE-family HTH domain